MTAAAARMRTAASITNPYDESPLNLTFFVSCYDEADYIIETLDTICSAAKEVGLSFEVLVIDDCSKDNTPKVVREYIVSHPDDNIVLRVNRRNKGFAQNYIDGAFLGKGKYYRCITGDFGEPRESVVAVLEAIGDADCIVPYYAVHHNRSIGRYLLSKAYTFVVNLISGNNLHYYNGLPVHLRCDVLRWHTNTQGFGFQAEILCLMLDLGFTYKEVSVTTFERRKGPSNALSLHNVFSVLHAITEIASRRISNLVYSLLNTR